MKVAILGYAHPFGKGQHYGAERHLWYLMRELRDMGHECVVFSVKGCVLPGFEFVEMPVPWEDGRDIYLEAIKRYEVENSMGFDFVYSAMASGYISPEIRDEWPYCVTPYMIFNRFPYNVVYPARVFSKASRNPGTIIPYGLREEDYPSWDPIHKDYLVWLGRMDMGKATDIALDIAERTNHKIIIMGPAYHYPWWVENVWPRIDNDKVVWLRAVTDEIKGRVLRGAKALLNPLWTGYAEMFGIVNIEALACGIPIIGWGNAQAPSAINFNGGEIIEHGKHGFIIEHNGYEEPAREQGIAKSIEALAQIDQISRYECRKLYEDRFSTRVSGVKTLKYMNIIRERGTVQDVTGEL